MKIAAYEAKIKECEGKLPRNDYPRTDMLEIARELNEFMKKNPLNEPSGRHLVNGTLSQLYDKVVHLQGLFEYLGKLPLGAFDHMEGHIAILKSDAGHLPPSEFGRVMERRFLDHPSVKMALVALALLVIVVAADLYFGFGITPGAIRSGLPFLA